MNNLNYGIIGNCRTAALVSESGSIDWCCFPDFDSSSIFASLLDKKIGGCFKIKVGVDCVIEQSYIKNTNILCTRYADKDDVFEVLDFMPRYPSEGEGYYNPPDIIRYFKHRSGEPKFSVDYKPKLEYAKFETVTVAQDNFIKSYTEKGDYDSLYLYTNFSKKNIINGETITLKQDAFVLLSYNQKILDQTLDLQYLKLYKTRVYWLDWANELTSFAKYQKEILRSALTLKLLSYDKTGAILAAATTSLPETIGEERNWDYRFCWIRDASMVIKVMAKLGHMEAINKFINFIIEIIPDKNEKVQIMYGINRQKLLPEKELTHLAGYENSRPVRIGNAAYVQKQNDIYGVLMDVIFQHFQLIKTTTEIGENLWTISRNIVKIVEQNWEKPDKGIWEIRTEEKHFTFSKVLCWVAIDRAISIARLINKDSYAELWSLLAKKIKTDIYKNGWNEKVKSFTQFYGSDDQDAANLLMEPYGFIDAFLKLMRSGRKYRRKNFNR